MIHVGSTEYTGAVKAGQVGLVDSDGTHYLLLDAGSDLSADRVLSLVTGDLARTITLSGDPTLGDWFDQGVKSADSPSFTAIATDTVTEKTTDAGVTVEGILLENGQLQIDASKFVFFDGADQTIAVRWIPAATALAFTIGGAWQVRLVTGGVTQIRGETQLDQASASGAVPVVSLDQGDVDEPFIKYRGTAAAADLTRSLVDVGDVTTPTLVGYAKVKIDDVGNQITDGDYYFPFYSLA